MRIPWITFDLMIGNGVSETATSKRYSMIDHASMSILRLQRTSAELMSPSLDNFCETE